MNTHYFTKKSQLTDAISLGTLKNDDIAYIKETGEIWTHGKFFVDLSEYTKTVDADKKYVKQNEKGAAIIGVDDKGALSNLSDNGQAYLAVRKKGNDFIIDNAFAGAAFGVKMDGTAAFSHKTYTTYGTDGKYTGARNTAVLQFAGPVGLRYAKNGRAAANDVQESDYKYVGVIDSPDDFQRVYSAKQVDALLKALSDRITALENK